MTTEELIAYLETYPPQSTIKLWDEVEEKFTDQVIIRFLPTREEIQITHC